MPLVLKSSDEAQKHLAESSREVAEKLKTLQKSLTTKEEHLGKALNVMGKGFDDIQTQCYSAWAAMSKLESTSTMALAGVKEVQDVCTLQQDDLKNIAKAVNDTEALATEAKVESSTALRVAQSNLTAAQDAQLAASQYCLIFKGIPQQLENGKESYRMLIEAFSGAMADLDLEKAFEPKSLRRIMKRREDKSTRPPHIRVELTSISHRVLIFDQMKEYRETQGFPTPVSYTHLTLPTKA